MLTALFCPVLTSAQKMTNRDLDFWIGEWDCYSEDSIIGDNKIFKTLDGIVIEENFHSFKEGFVGKSWSVFDSIASLWKQTWVDNSGSYMVFSGAVDKDTLIFAEDNPVTLKGQKVYRRMIFYSMQSDSFDWKWQSSTDKINWKTNWYIKYKRKTK